MDKMDMFNKDDNKYSTMSNILGDTLVLTESEKVFMQLYYVCEKLSAYIVAKGVHNTINVIPTVTKSNCAIRIIVGSYKPMDIDLVSEGRFCTNGLLTTDEFILSGIANPKDVIYALNNIFKASNFMLDIDTNEN